MIHVTCNTKDFMHLFLLESLTNCHRVGEYTRNLNLVSNTSRRTSNANPKKLCLKKSSINIRQNIVNTYF